MDNFVQNRPDSVGALVGQVTRASHWAETCKVLTEIGLGHRWNEALEKCLSKLYGDSEISLGRFPFISSNFEIRTRIEEFR